MDWITRLVEAVKLPTRYVSAIFLGSTLLLVFPSEFLDFLKLGKFVERFDMFIGIISLSSGVILFVNILISFTQKVQSKLKRNQFRKKMSEKIEILDPDEKSVLREFFLQGRNTLKLPFDHPVVAGLLQSGVLTQVGSMGRMSMAGMLVNIKISDHARSSLVAHHLDLPLGEPSESELNFLRRNRPPFVTTIEREDSLF
jgi:hypothetical protein